MVLKIYWLETLICGTQDRQLCIELLNTPDLDLQTFVASVFAKCLSYQMQQISSHGVSHAFFFHCIDVYSFVV